MSHKTIFITDIKINIMKTLLLTVIMALYASSTSSQTAIENIIGTIPKQIVPYLTDSQLKEQAHDAGLNMTAKGEEKDRNDTLVIIKNVFGGSTTIDSLSNNFAIINLNSVTDLQIRILPYNDSTQILCVVKTVNKPIKESIVNFYTTDWYEIKDTFNLPKNVMGESLTADFLQKPDTMQSCEYMELCKYFEPVIIYADFSNANDIISYEISIPFVPHGKHDELKAITRKNMFKWTGNSFKKC